MLPSRKFHCTRAPLQACVLFVCWVIACNSHLARSYANVMTAEPDSILRAFITHCTHDPQRIALLFAGQQITYAQLAAVAVSWAERLRSLGLQRGERVALFLENSPLFLAAYLGTQLAGGIVVLINTQYRQMELRHILSDSAARCCITDAARHSELQRVLPDLPDLAHVLELDTESSAAFAANSSLDIPALNAQLPAPNDIALIGYTSGTTGRAKGAMLSHGNLVANSIAVTTAWRWTADDRLLLTLPLFHIHGLGVGIHGTLLTGASVDLRPRFDATEVLETLLQGEVTLFFGVPTMYTRLIAVARERFAASETGAQVAPFAAAATRVRLFVSGSAPLSTQTFAEFAELFGQPILERYGMTETVMNLTNPYDGERRPGTVGMPFPGQEARIVDVQSRQPLPDGELGEIQVRGPHVFQGYWQRPDATAAAFDAEGWFNTGDLGWRSADGYFTIAGRAHDLIISGGYNVYPREIEEVLLRHPAVAEVAVLGMPHPDLGEQVVAAVVCATPPADVGLADELIALCRDQLASYKKPRQIFFVAALPRNAMGKVQKHLLRDQLAA